MKRFAALVSFLGLLVFLTGCHFNLGHTVAGSGVRKTETRNLPAFSEINATGSFYIEASSQKSASVQIEADDNILPLVKTEVRDGVLYLKPEKGFNSKQGVVVRITLPDLTKIDSTGASTFRVENIQNDRLEIRTTGASNVVVSGKTSDVQIKTTGAGEVDAHDLRATRADVKSSGAAKVNVYASEQLDANVSGAGHVEYSGNPKVVNKHTSGAATVSPREASGV